ncbi:hypothetical protein V8D89_007816 [Ganoderma adspersum]
MPPTHKFDFYFPSRPSNSSARAEDTQLMISGKGDATKPQREENNHHRKPGHPPEGSVFMFKGSTDKKDEVYPAGAEDPLGATHILDRRSRERLLLAINKAPTNRLRQAFQALVSSVDDIPEGTYRMLAVMENAGGPQVPQQSVQSAGEDPSHRQRQASAVPEGGPGVTNARGHLQIPGPAKVNPGTHLEPYRDLPGAAPYVCPPPQPLHHWPVRMQYQPQPQSQSLRRVKCLKESFNIIPQRDSTEDSELSTSYPKRWAHQRMRLVMGRAMR